MSLNVNVSSEESVVSPEKREKRYVVYKVIVNAEGQSWLIFRRYNEFHALNEKLRKRYPDMNLKLPGKSWFANNFDSAFLRQRREGLHEFLCKLVTDERVYNDRDVRLFLNVPAKLLANGDESTASPQGVKISQSRDDLALTKWIAKPSDFKFLKVIGKGSFGKVLLGQHVSDGRLYAVKVLNKTHIVRRNEVKHIMSERNVLCRKHPFLVRLHFSFQTTDKLYFVMDFVTGGELFFHLQNERCFSEGRAQFYAAEIASALGFLHANNVIYRDLKPENILLDSEGHVVLTDFGLCKEGLVDNGKTSTFCGTPEYLAPEVLRKISYDRSVDWWGLGVVLYEMIFALPPFYSKNTPEMYRAILEKPLTFRGKSSSRQARSVLSLLLQKNPAKRLGSSGDVGQVAAHAFFDGIDWSRLESRKIAPPFVPRSGKSDRTDNIDPGFGDQPVPESVSGEDTLAEGRMSESIVHASQQFAGFSFVDGSALDD